MKYIHYQMQMSSEEEEVILSDVKMNYSEPNLEIAKREAYNGEYTIEDDGQPEPEPQPTEAERIAELEAMMNALLGVSE